MSHTSFDNKSSRDKLNRLIQLYEDFKLDRTSSDKAEELSSSAWHLTDWVFEEFGTKLSVESLGEFRDALYPQCESLKVMHDLATGAKHSKVSRPKASIKEAITKPGPFSGVFSKQFKQTVLQIELQDGRILYFIEEIDKVVEFWRSYFSTQLHIEI